jgi:hypothetical protein
MVQTIEVIKQFSDLRQSGKECLLYFEGIDYTNSLSVVEKDSIVEAFLKEKTLQSKAVGQDFFIKAIPAQNSALFTTLFFDSWSSPGYFQMLEITRQLAAGTLVCNDGTLGTNISPFVTFDAKRFEQEGLKRELCIVKNGKQISLLYQMEEAFDYIILTKRKDGGKNF